MSIQLFQEEIQSGVIIGKQEKQEGQGKVTCRGVVERLELAPLICEHSFEQFGSTPSEPRRTHVCHGMGHITTVNVLVGLGVSPASAASRSASAQTLFSLLN